MIDPTPTTAAGRDLFAKILSIVEVLGPASIIVHDKELSARIATAEREAAAPLESRVASLEGALPDVERLAVALHAEGFRCVPSAPMDMDWHRDWARTLVAAYARAALTPPAPAASGERSEALDLDALRARLQPMGLAIIPLKTAKRIEALQATQRRWAANKRRASQPAEPAPTAGEDVCPACGHENRWHVDGHCDCEGDGEAGLCACTIGGIK